VLQVLCEKRTEDNDVKMPFQKQQQQQQIVGVKGELSEEEQAFLHTKLSPVSRRNYVLALRQFKQFSGIREDIVMLDPKVLKGKLVDYITYLKENGRSYSTQNQAISSIQKLYQIHDLAGINWQNVRGYTSDDYTINGGDNDDQPYTRAELQLLVENASPRTKAIVLTMLSTGMRVGALPGLRMKHLQKIEDKKLYKVQVYADSKRDRYRTFCTPECAAAIDAYLSSREIAGEVIKPDSPVFRTQFLHRHARVQCTGLDVNANVKGMSKNAVFKAVEDLAIRVGIRTIRRKTASGYAQPHGKPLTHSFRKIMNTSLIRAGTKPVVVELLMGHAIGLQHNYLRLSDQELCDEYCKALDMLTVSQEKHLQQENAKLRMEVADVDKLRSEVSEVSAVKQELFELREQNKWLYDKFNIIIRKKNLGRLLEGFDKAMSSPKSRFKRKKQEEEEPAKT
jgi:integrase